MYDLKFYTCTFFTQKFINMKKITFICFLKKKFDY